MCEYVLLNVKKNSIDFFFAQILYTEYEFLLFNFFS